MTERRDPTGRRITRLAVLSEKLRFVLSWLVLITLLMPGLVAALEIPFLSSQVEDQASLLSAASRQSIEDVLRRLEKDTGAQVAVLTLPTLDGEDLEDFSLKVAETWKLGRGRFDDGALLLVVRDDRKMRLEVGYGLEPTLTDALSSRVLNEVMLPSFRAGDFDGGIAKAVEAIDGTLRGQSTLPPPDASPRNVVDVSRALFGLAIFSFVALRSGRLGCVIYFFLVLFGYGFASAIAGPLGRILFFAWLIGFPLLWALLHRTLRGRAFRDRHLNQGRGGWSSSRGWGGGGGSSGGSFSGGGGSFGGGGASSSW